MQLAEALRCARSTVTTWEASASFPRPDMLARIVDLLGVSACELIEESNGPTLKGLRTAAGLRQCDVAWALAIQPSSYCDVEKGRQRIPDRWFPVLSEMFGKSERTVRDLLQYA